VFKYLANTQTRQMRELSEKVYSQTRQVRDFAEKAAASIWVWAIDYREIDPGDYRCQNRFLPALDQSLSSFARSNMLRTDTNHGTRCVHNGYKYSFRYKYKDGRERFRCCSEKFCKSVVVIKDEEILTGPTGHNIDHKSMDQHAVDVQVVRVAAKRKAMEEIGLRPCKIIRTAVR